MLERRQAILDVHFFALLQFELYSPTYAFLALQDYEEILRFLKNALQALK